MLTLENPKTKKGEDHGYVTGVLMLAPHTVSGWNVCSHSTPGCRASCLFRAGRGVTEYVERARIKKTKRFVNRRQRPLALRLLRQDIEALHRKAERESKRVAVRLNGTSDLPWEKLAPELFREFPDVCFYDYTKNTTRAERWLHGAFPRNYYLLFSRSENTPDVMVGYFLRRGMNVAVVYGAPLGFGEFAAKAWVRWGHEVIDGDRNDLRFLETRSRVVAVREKGPARYDGTGFVVRG